MTTLTAPRARPKLPPVTDFPVEPPVPVPTDPADGPTLAWTEALRDHYEKDGALLTVPGLLKICDTAGLDPTQTADLKKQVRRLYAAEHESAQNKSPAKPKSPATPKEKTVTTATKAAPKKTAAKKAAPAKKAAAKTKPSANGNGHVQAQVVFDKTVRGLKVVVAKTNDRLRATVDGIPFRKVLQWMGKAGFVTGEAKAAAALLLKDYKGGEQYAAAMVEEGHVGAGRNADKDGNTVFGPMAPVPAATAKNLKALKK